jgi:hypothetical protein
MPSPFPGMDPYMESNRFWRGVHQLLIATATTALNRQLPPSFVARIEERVYTQAEARNVYPDIAVARREPVPAASGVAVLDAPVTSGVQAPFRLRLPVERMRESFIEIWTIGESERVVATVEVLSPTNKLLGVGWEEYRRKQREMRERGIHLLEIDLLRNGEHSVLAPRADLLEQFGSWDYLISLYRAPILDVCEAWPVRLRNPLPTVPVPLTTGFPDVELNLQTVLNQVYEDGAFSRSIDYTGEPTSPLSLDDALWADTLLREQHLRPSSPGISDVS